MNSVTHVVLVDWKPAISDAEVRRIRGWAQSFDTEIPGVIRVAEGPSRSPEGLENGFDYALVIDFADAASRDGYLTHPAHLPLARALHEGAQRLVVFDIHNQE